MRIESLCREQIEQALPMIWDVFCKYEAVNYPASGRDVFWKAIHDPQYLQMLSAYGAFEEEQLVGIIATRNNGSHIALFFVEGEYHRRGIGRKLMAECLAKSSSNRIIVNSSEYAVEIYERLGFVRTDELKEDSGIRYVPMECAFSFQPEISVSLKNG